MLTWSQKFRIQTWVVSSMWLIPVGFVIAAVALAWLMPQLDDALSLKVPFTYSVSAATATLSAIASGMLVFTGFVFSIITFAIQFGSSSYTNRLLRSISRNTGTKVALGVFVATFIYSLLLLADISPRGEGRVPNLSVLFAVVLVGISVLVFLRLIADVTDSIRSGRVVADVGRSGRRVIEATFPLPVTADTPPSSSGAARYTPDAPGHEVGCPRSGGGVLQAMDLDGIVAIAEEARVTVELVPEIGEFVSTGAPVFRVYGASQTIGARLLDSVAFGDERTFRQDPSFSLRILVDVALKALSPAVNDPTTAVESLGRIEDLLLLLGSRWLPDGVCRDAQGEVRFVYRTPSWEDDLDLSLTEIRLFGASTPSVAARMRELLETLHGNVPLWRQAAVEEQMRLLDQATTDSGRA